MPSPFSVTISSGKTVLRAGESTVVTFTFSTAVKGFDTADLELPPGCTISAPQAVSPNMNGASSTWTVTLTANADTQYTSGKLGVNLSGMTGEVALAYRPGEGTTYSDIFYVDTRPPKLLSNGIRLDKTALSAGESTTVRFVFTEAVANFKLENVDVGAGATLSNLVSSQGPDTVGGQKPSSVWSATLTVGANTQPGGGIISVRMAGFVDLLGNPGQGDNVNADFTVKSGTAGRPELVANTGIVVDKTTIKAGETATVTFTFTEAVTGFDASDVVLPSGFTLSTPQASNATNNGASTTWTATLTPPTNLDSSSHVLAVRLTGVTDTSGDAGVGTSPYSASFTVDTRAPALASNGITLSKTALKANETATVTFTFTEAVTGFEVSDVNLPTGATLTNLQASSPTNGASTTWTATLTPPASTQATTANLSVNLAGVSDVAGNPGAGISSATTFQYDTQAPTMSTTAGISLNKYTLKAGDSATVTFQFNEAVTNFDLGDIDLPQGWVLSNPASGTPGAASTTWTATLTPPASTQSSTGVITVRMAGITDAAGNAGTGTQQSQQITVDTAAPTLLAVNGITVDKTTIKAGETATVTFTFSEPVNNFDPPDLVRTPSSGFTLSNPAPVNASNGASAVWTATLTPTADTESTSASISVRTTGVTDVAGNAGTGDNVSSNSFTIDTRPPQLVPNTGISLDKTTIKTGETATVTFTFNEAVRGLDLGDLDLPTGWILSTPVASNPTNNGASTVWTATLSLSTTSQPASSGAITLRLNGVSDAAGNAGNETGHSQTITVDTTPPTLAANGITVNPSTIKVGQTATVTFTFSEAVTGFDASDVVLPSGFTLSTPQASNAANNGASTTWTATLTPPTDRDSSSYTLAVRLSGVADTAGNAGGDTSPASASFTVDTRAPALAAITLSKTALKANETATVTFTFTEAVTGFEVSDVNLPTGATLTNLQASSPTNGASTTWTATLTPPASTQATTANLSVNLAGVSDVAGNPGASNSSVTTFHYDTQAPTMSTTAGISVSKPTLKAGETATVTFTFNEAVKDFDLGDIDLPQGWVLSNPASGAPGGGASTTWTATLSVPLGMQSNTGVITVRMAGITDAAGNAGDGRQQSQQVTVDTAAPTLLTTNGITVDKTTIKAGETATVTFRFSEPVTGLDPADLVLTPSSGFTLSNPAPVNAGSNGASAQWTATLTPTANTELTNASISVRITGVTDVANNAGAGDNVSSNSFAIDTRAPQLLPNTGINVDKSTIKVGETATVTFTFNEAVTGLGLDDLDLPTGWTLSTPVASNAATNGASTVWTATLTPPANSQSASGTITLRLNGVNDVAGNPGDGTQHSQTITVDTTKPTLAANGITVSPSTIKVGETATVTFTFSEAVTDFDASDVVLPTGFTLSTPQASNATDGASTTWTATLTPPGNTQSVSNTLAVRLDGVHDSAGNAGSGTSPASASFTTDTTRPTLTGITLNKTTIKASETATVTFTFSEAVTGLDAADVVLPPGFQLSTPAASNAVGGASTTWTATLTPPTNLQSSQHTLAVTMSGVADSAGNAGSGQSAASSSFTVDTSRPTLASINFDKTALRVGETATVTFTFNEAVTGLDASDVTLPAGCTLSAPVASNPTNGASTIWTATLTPPARTQLTTGTVSVDLSGISDVAGNAGVGNSPASSSITFDTNAPSSAMTTPIELSKTTLTAAANTATVTFTFNEPMKGFDVGDVSLPTGWTLSALSPVGTGTNVPAANGGGVAYTQWTATLTAPANTDKTTGTISVLMSGLTDVSGNAGTGLSNPSPMITIDTKAPTLNSITLDKSVLKIDEHAFVTFTFSEPVNDFDINDIGVPDGFTLSDPAMVNGSGGASAVWRATLTPVANTQSKTGTITVHTTGVHDVAGNAGGGDSAPNASITVDTRAPALLANNGVTISSSKINAGGSATVTFTFTEAVRGLELVDIILPQGCRLTAPVASNATNDGASTTWTATLSADDGIVLTNQTLGVRQAGVADVAGNQGSGDSPASASNSFSVDTQRPTLAANNGVVFEKTTLGAGQTSKVTFTFSEAVTGFDVGDVTVPNGTLAGMEAVDAAGNAISGGSNASSTTWRATFAPTAGVDDATNQLSINLAGVTDAAGNAGQNTANSGNYVVDTVRPTMVAGASAIELGSSALKAGESTTVTFRFAEAVSGFAANDVTVANGTLSNVQALDASGSPVATTNPSATVWRATLTPTADVQDATNLLTVNLAGVTDAAGNAGEGTRDSANYTVDTRLPTLTSAAFANAALKAGETTTVTFTFSEAVSGFEIADVTAPNGALSGLQAVDAQGNVLTGAAATSSAIWRATFTPTPTVEDATNQLSVNLAGVTDAAGNAGTGSATSPNYTVDTQRPTLATADIAIADSALKAGETTRVTFTFSEAVSGFDIADVTVPNGALSGLQAVDAHGNVLTGAAATSSAIWRATLTPTPDVEDATNLLTVNLAGVTDAAGNAGVGTAASENYTVDTRRPTLPTANIAIADNALKAGETTTVTFTFSEAVTGFDTGDVTAPGGVLSNLVALDAAGNPLTGGSSASSTTWRATFAPTGDLEDATNLLTVNLAGVTDSAGNIGSGSATSANYTIDTLRPTLTTANIAIADTALKVGDTSTVTFTFSEAVTGFDIADVTVPNGTLSGLQAVDAQGNVLTGAAATSSAIWRATLTPSTSAEDATNQLSVNLAGVTDAAGNAGVGSVASANYSVDTQRPTLAPANIVIADSALKVGDTSTVTFTFSEAVSGFDTSDVTVPNGTLTGLQAVDAQGNVLTGAAATSSAIWRATLTPREGVEDATNALSVDMTGVSDAAGNAGVGTVASANYTVDTLRPTLRTANIAIADTALKVGDTSTVTFTFSEAVSGFDTSDVTVANGTLSAIQAVDAQGNVLTGAAATSSAIWRATLTPRENMEDESNTLSVNLAGVTDAAGNAGVGTVESANYTVDTLRPTANSLSVITTARVLATDPVNYRLSVTFSEAVTGLTADSFTVPNGTLSNLTSNDGGRTWSATLTPTRGVEDDTNEVVLNLTGVTDLAGNHLASTSIRSGNYVVDTRAPVVASASANGNRVVLSYTDGSTLDATNLAAATAFSVQADNVANTVVGVAVDAAAKTVTLTLANSVLSGQTVRVSYLDPSAADDANAVQDAFGNDAASFTNMTAANNTAAPASPPAPANPGGGGVPVDTDTDDDGVNNATENAAPGMARPNQPTIAGDANGDGIRDSVQANVGSLDTTTLKSDETSYTTLVAGSQEGKADSDAATTRINSMEQQKNVPTDLPHGMETPLGLLSFSATLGSGRSTESFSLYVDQGLGINGYWVKDKAGTWVNLASEAHGGKMVSEGGRLRLDFKIEDGSQYDSDGVVNGQISVPQGVTGKMPLSIVGLAPDAAHPGLWF